MAANVDTSLSNFLLGLEVVFGYAIKHDDEFADFMLAAEDFYNDYRGLGKVGEPQARSLLPFWRYLIKYSAESLDEAACSSQLDAQREEDLTRLGSAMAVYWPLLPALVTQAWREPAVPTRVDAGVQTEEMVLPASLPVEEAVGPAISQRPPYFRSATPLVPPVSYTFVDGSPMTTPVAEKAPLFSPESTRRSIQTMKRQDSASEFPTMLSRSSSELSEASVGTPTLEYTTSMDSRSRTSSAVSHSTDGITTPPQSQTPRLESKEPTLILADRGDNAARLYPVADGAYVLQVSIGGRKLVVNPEKPTQISYHDQAGAVVTRSLLGTEDVDT